MICNVKNYIISRVSVNSVVHSEIYLNIADFGCLIIFALIAFASHGIAAHGTGRRQHPLGPEKPGKSEKYPPPPPPPQNTEKTKKTPPPPPPPQNMNPKKGKPLLRGGEKRVGRGGGGS